jgi:3',5'-cyclic AMP phosphodiesterase CpdA
MRGPESDLRIILLHLSDIHLRSTKDAVAGRAHRIKETILAKCPDPAACFIAVSGDVANTGDPVEYDVAKSFFIELRSSLLLAGVSQVELIVIPGNHDCNLTRQNETRTFLLESIDSYLKKSVDLDGSNFAALIEVLQDFFAFEAEICGHEPLPISERLYYKRIFNVAGNSVVFHCFNTAWLSQRHEVQSRLYFPPELLIGSTDASAILSIALFHHPYSWLNNENYRALKSYVEGQADIILIGHEHVGGGARKQTFSGEQMDYFEAPALQDWDSGASGFQMSVLDTSADKQTISPYTWTGSRYAEGTSRDWKLIRNPARPSKDFGIASDFLVELRGIGTGFRHPRCTPPRCELVLRDLYVYPDLRERPIEAAVTGKGKPAAITGELICDYLTAKERVVVYGADDSGKSSLTKILYEDLHDRGLLPLLLRGEDLKGRTKDGSLVALLRECAANQYGPLYAEAYLQQDPSKRLLIIDDFHFAQLTKVAQKTVMDRLRPRFKYILILASDLFRLEELTRSIDGGAFNDFTQCDIKEFGKFHRHRLIEKWQYLGREDNTEPEELAKLVLWTDKTIATLLGKNVLPHYPVTILQLLQLLEVRETASTTNGSYGYLYEVLIKSALIGSESGVKDVDLKVTYMSGLAYFMFKSSIRTVTETEFRAAHDEYCKRYDIIRDFSKMTAELCGAGMLVESKGLYRFKYPYVFYYSVAKYFQENADALKSELNGVADHIYNDANANILIFYVYLTKDAALIRRLIDSAKAIYDEFSPCDMVDDVDFINKMITRPARPLQLTSTDVRTNRDEYNRRQDAAVEARQESEEKDTAAGDYAYNRQLEDVVKLNIAFKTLQILGQVLRNFPGSLDGSLKLDITRECYLLGLRTVHALLSIAENNLESFRSYIADILAERTGLTDEELAARADMAVAWLTEAATFGSIKRVSYAVGHQELTATYQRVIKSDDGLPIRIIDTAIKLDHYDQVPERELQQLRAIVQKNPFAGAVVRDLVADYLYLYGCDFPTVQKLAADWNIKIIAPQLLLNRAKKT